MMVIVVVIIMIIIIVIIINVIIISISIIIILWFRPVWNTIFSILQCEGGPRVALCRHD